MSVSTGRVRVAVVGATGYAGAELVRLLSRHPDAELTVVTSERDAGNSLASVHPYLAHTGLDLVAADVGAIADAAEVAFVALPHGASTPIVAGLVESGLRVVDIGADFRFRDVAVYEYWYGQHEAPELLDEAVYGLTEYAREEVRDARLIANPGCYPTGALLALLPVAEHLGESVFIDSKSGTSGAGRAADTKQLFAEVAENIRPYKTWQHRHQPEMVDALLRLGGSESSILFSPHLLPIARGLLSSCYVELDSNCDVGQLYERAYGSETFVTVLPEGEMPEPRNVRGTNRVEIGWLHDRDAGVATLVSAIDNLGKGAAGQAVQNFNCMLRVDERRGLDQIAALP